MDLLPQSLVSNPLGEGGLDQVPLGGRLGVKGSEAGLRDPGRRPIRQDEGEVGDVDLLESLDATEGSSPGSGFCFNEDLLWVWP